jgi:hypothetical protein
MIRSPQGHSRSALEAQADRVVVMEHGAVANGPPLQVTKVCSGW